jgi:membrane protein DedA with SNARE-associated domain
MAEHAERYGVWAVAVGRPVPVLAEASVLLAGTARLPFRRFLVVCSLSNLGISLVYAVAGALSATAGSFFLALAAAVVVPAVASLALRRRRGREAEIPAMPAKSE